MYFHCFICIVTCTVFIIQYTNVQLTLCPFIIPSLYTHVLHVLSACPSSCWFLVPKIVPSFLWKLHDLYRFKHRKLFLTTFYRAGTLRAIHNFCKPLTTFSSHWNGSHQLPYRWEIPPTVHHCKTWSKTPWRLPLSLKTSSDILIFLDWLTVVNNLIKAGKIHVRQKQTTGKRVG